MWPLNKSCHWLEPLSGIHQNRQLSFASLYWYPNGGKSFAQFLLMYFVTTLSPADGRWKRNFFLSYQTFNWEKLPLHIWDLVEFSHTLQSDWQRVWGSSLNLSDVLVLHLRYSLLDKNLPVFEIPDFVNENRVTNMSSIKGLLCK